MKNKKGFTLIELIAVIALLAVILLLIVPNVINILDEGRKDAFVNQVQSIMRATENQYGLDTVLKMDSYVYCSDYELLEGNSNPSYLNKSDFKSNNLLAYSGPIARGFEVVPFLGEPCKPLDLNLNAVKYVVVVNKRGKIVKVGVQDDNYCYVTEDPSIVIDKDDLEEGVLSCNNYGECSCGEGSGNGSGSGGYVIK